MCGVCLCKLTCTGQGRSVDGQIFSANISFPVVDGFISASRILSSQSPPNQGQLPLAEASMGLHHSSSTDKTHVGEGEENVPGQLSY